MSDHRCCPDEQQEQTRHGSCQPPEVVRDLQGSGGEVCQQGQGRGPVGPASSQAEEDDLRCVSASQQSPSWSHNSGGDLLTSAWQTGCDLPSQAGCRSGSGCQGCKTSWRSAADQTEASSLCPSSQWRSSLDPEVTSSVPASNSNSQ